MEEQSKYMMCLLFLEKGKLYKIRYQNVLMLQWKKYVNYHIDNQLDR